LGASSDKKCILFLCGLFNDAVDYEYYMASVMDELISIEHWWNKTDVGKP
jgi:hypothetical protein